MYRVSDDEIDYILKDIKSRGVELEDLQYNLLDHVCCIIEHEMPANEDFYKFYGNTIPRFFKKELREIEEETINLLTFKNYYAMKRTLKIMGSISAFLMLLGSLFKIMHWPGAGVLLVTFMAVFSLIFLPLLIVLKLRDEVSKMEKVLFGFGTVLGIIASMGTLFKLMRWPGANMLMVGSMILFLAAFIPMYFIVKSRNKEDRFNVILNTTLMLAGGGMLFALMNLKTSQDIETSIFSVHQFLRGNTEQLTSSNTVLYKSVSEIQADEYGEGLHLRSEALLMQIQDVKALLVSKADEISIEAAKKRNMEEVQGLKNSSVVWSFANGEYVISEKEITEAINLYNEGLKPNLGHQINLKHLQMHQTNLGLLYHQLTQIEMQIAINENSYLNYLNGSLAKM